MKVPKQQQNALYTMIVGSHKSPKQAFLVMDGKVVCEIPVNGVPNVVSSLLYL